MSFFNKKEDVIDIQLTQYGKHLLSKGKFKPSHYAFFDEDILYDAGYADSNDTETQNEVQTRIEETPYLKTQHVYSSRDKSVIALAADLRTANLAPDAKVSKNLQRPSAEKHYSLDYPIGTSTLANNKFPAWSVSFLKGGFDDQESHLDPYEKAIKIPQINSEDINFTTKVEVDHNNLSNAQISDSLQDSFVMYSDKYPDNSYIVVDEDYILLDVGELNVDFDNENFDIEVFLIDNPGPTETYIPLSFVKEPIHIKDGILLDKPEGGLNRFDENNPTYTDPNYVGYWFDIYCDREIEDDVLCEKLPETETRGNIFTQDFLSCPEKVITTKVSDVGIIEEEEEC